MRDLKSKCTLYHILTHTQTKLKIEAMKGEDEKRDEKLR